MQPQLKTQLTLTVFFTNELEEIATLPWIADNYSARNWIEVFYRETKSWLGMTEYQVRD